MNITTGTVGSQYILLTILCLVSDSSETLKELEGSLVPNGRSSRECLRSRNGLSEVNADPCSTLIEEQI